MDPVELLLQGLYVRNIVFDGASHYLHFILIARQSFFAGLLFMRYNFYLMSKAGGFLSEMRTLKLSFGSTEGRHGS